VTHDQAEALSFADQVAVLRDGRLAQVGAPQALYSHPADRATATFLGDAILLPAELGDGWAQCALGRVAIDADARRGLAEIMLRPEQLLLTPVSSEPSVAHGNAATCKARVAHVEFGGAACTVTVALSEGAGPRHLPIRCASADLPVPGACVQITISGNAHVFEPSAR